MKIESREVLAAVYPKHRLDAGQFLRHAVEVDDNGCEVRVLCRRVKLENLADPGSGDPSRPPTCKACVAAVRKLRAKESKRHET